MPNGMLVTSPEAATRLGVSVRTIHRLVAAGNLQPVHKLPGPNGAFLFEDEVVEQAARTRAVAAAS